MNRLKRALLTLAFCILLVLLSSLPLFAEESEQTWERIPEEYITFLESLPEEITARLPEGLFSQDAREVEAAINEMSDFSYLVRTLLSLVGLELAENLSLLASISGVLILSAIFSAVKSSIRREDVAKAFSFCATLAILSCLLGVGYECISAVSGYFERLLQITAALVPLTAGLYAMGGNVTTAVASSSGLSIFMTLLEAVIGKTIVPFCSICLAFCTVGALDPSLRLGTLLSTLKKNYTTLLAFLMMLLLAMLAMQTTLGTRADTLAMRSAKFAAGNLIPVVGGSVAELLRSVGAGISYLRGTVGICAVLLLLLILFPTLVKLFLSRLVFQLCASVADLFACESEKRLLEEFSSIGGFLITAVSICSAVLLLSLSLFIHSAAAIG